MITGTTAERLAAVRTAMQSAQQDVTSAEDAITQMQSSGDVMIANMRRLYRVDDHDAFAVLLALQESIKKQFEAAVETGTARNAELARLTAAHDRLVDIARLEAELSDIFN